MQKEELKDTADLVIESGIKIPCSYYDQFGICSVLDCLCCDNSYFKISFKNTESIVFNGEEKSLDRFSLDDTYEILFFDRVPNIEELYSYIYDDDSEYIIINKDTKLVVVDKLKKNKQYKLTKKTF